MKNILGLLPKILLGVALFILVVTNLAIAYIFFAPDTLPKPFYPLYAMPEQVVATAESENEHGEGEHVDLSNLPPGQGLMVDTGSKIVNLVDPTGRKYLRVGVVLEFAPKDPEYFEMPEEEKQAYITTFNQEMESRLPVINDILITLFASQTFDKVYTAEGKEHLRQQIKELINQQLPEYHVIYVYFTEFVVQ
ncbi:MAG: flagellar basal body-associated FliL family protein [Anaerolineales bacterium]|nr:flagellar basal body-associated FliL family protein [Anaerolineales bacterium]